MKKICFLFVLFINLFYQAQVVSGKIVSNENKSPVPYAKIGIEGENNGTIADEKGNFSFDVSKIEPTKNVKIETGGYEVFKMPVATFSKKNNFTIVLSEKVKSIQEVKISPKKLVSKNWGNNTKTKSVQIGHNPSIGDTDRSKEVAILFKTSKKTKIEKIHLNIANFQSDRPVFIRFNFYDDKMNLINSQDIHDEITADKIVDGTYTLDVSKYKIWMNANFYIGFEILNHFEGRLYLSGALFGNSAVYRNFDGQWQKVPVASPAINIDVKVDKNYKNIDEDDKKSIDIEDQFANNPTSIKEIKDEIEKYKYGNNSAVGKYYKTKDLEMYYEIYGSGEPLFLLHGNGGNIQAFYKQIPELSKHYKVIAVDTRAQGNSIDYTKENFTYELFADDLKNLADHLSIKKANIIGWSDGGIIGLIYAMKYPDNTNKLVAIGANTTPNGVAESDIVNMKQSLEKEEKENPENLNGIRLLRLMLDEPNLSAADLGKIKSPTLIVAGEFDIILPEHTETIAKSIPNATLKIVKGATHSLIQEKPEEFNDMVLKFFKK